MKTDTPVTDLLHAWEDDAPQALDELVALVYTDLREMSRRALQGERPGHTLNPTAIVHEVYMRLARLKHVSWENRKPFFSFAATLMRRILVDYARAMGAERRGGDRKRVDLEAAGLTVDEKPLDVLVLDDALARLEARDPFLVKIIEQKVFAGLTDDQTAEVLGVSRTKIQREWRIGKRLVAEILGGTRP